VGTHDEVYWIGNPAIASSIFLLPSLLIVTIWIVSTIVPCIEERSRYLSASR
jgi:hypothetical protein